MLPFGQLWYHFVMIEIQMGLLYEQLDKLLFEEQAWYKTKGVVILSERSESKDLHTEITYNSSLKCEDPSTPCFALRSG